MSNTIAPVFTDSATSWISPQGLTKGNIVRSAALDLRSKIGAKIHYAAGHTYVATPVAFTAGLEPRFRIYRTLNNDATLWEQLPPIPMDLTVHIEKLINNNPGPYAVGTSAFAVDGTGTPAYNDIFCFTGLTAAPANTDAMAGMEFFTVSNFASNTITTTMLSKKTHADNTYVTSKALVGSLWLPGGHVYRACWDYGGETATTDPIGVDARYSTYDNDLVS